MDDGSSGWMSYLSVLFILNLSSAWKLDYYFGLNFKDVSRWFKTGEKFNRRL